MLKLEIEKKKKKIEKRRERREHIKCNKETKNEAWRMITQRPSHTVDHSITGLSGTWAILLLTVLNHWQNPDEDSSPQANDGLITLMQVAVMVACR